MGQVKIIIDFDSTLVSAEGLEELAALALKDNPEKGKILDQIKEITDLGMDGRITFQDSLSRRLPLLGAGKSHVRELAGRLKGRITPSIGGNREFFARQARNIYVLSGGFLDFMLPATRTLGIDDAHVLGNTFRYAENDDIAGFAEDNCLSRAGGKVEQVRRLGLAGPVWVLGDGWTDYEIKEQGLADRFFTLTENVSREKVMAAADKNFADFIKYHEKYGAQR